MRALCAAEEEIARAASAMRTPSLPGHVNTLLMTNNGVRAEKLVNVVTDWELRAWLRIPLRLALVPFFILAQVAKWVRE